MTRVRFGWLAFRAYLVEQCRFTAEGAVGHSEWVRGRPFTSPDEWMGPEGDHFRKKWMMPPLHDAAAGWEKFKAEHADLILLLDDAEQAAERAVAA